MIRRVLVVSGLAVWAACGTNPGLDLPERDAGATGVSDAGAGAAPVADAGAADVADAGRADAGAIDAGRLDAGLPDAGRPDAGTMPVPDAGPTFTGIKKVFVIPMENQGTSAVYSSANAPYLNGTLMVQGAYATMYGDVLGPAILSEPHYIWLEAGTNVFSDHTFSNDADVSATNSTSSTAHLVTQLKNAQAPKTWRAYQEGINASTGACPIASSGFYGAKHDPFVFFQDVSGNPPSKTDVDCAAHHRAYTPAAFQADLAANDVADYTFITPNLCNDMHGAACTNLCLGSATIGTCVSTGDAWLQANVPAILAYVTAHDGVLLIIWDEPQSSGTQPFVIIGPHVKPGYASAISYSHSSYLKSLEEIMRVPVLPTVTSATDFADFFQAGYFP